MPESTDLWDGGTEPAKPTSIARHAIVAAALACGIGLGAALGLTVFDPTLDSTFDPADTTQPVVMVPQLEAPAGGPPAPAQPLPGHHPAPNPEHQPLPKPIAAASESAPVLEAPPTAAEPPHAEVSSPAVDGPGQPTLPPPSSGNPGDTAVTVDIDVPQLPQPEPVDPEEPQKPGPTNELGPISDLPDLKPQLPPKFTLVPPKSRWTVELPNQKPPKSTRGVPSTKKSRLNSIAKP